MKRGSLFPLMIIFLAIVYMILRQMFPWHWPIIIMAVFGLLAVFIWINKGPITTLLPNTVNLKDPNALPPRNKDYIDGREKVPVETARDIALEKFTKRKAKSDRENPKGDVRDGLRRR